MRRFLATNLAILFEVELLFCIVDISGCHIIAALANRAL